MKIFDSPKAAFAVLLAVVMFMKIIIKKEMIL